MLEKYCTGKVFCTKIMFTKHNLIEKYVRNLVCPNTNRACCWKGKSITLIGKPVYVVHGRYCYQWL